MRLQLGLACLLAWSGVAHADDTVELRGQYYKERSTTVIQPTADIEKDIGASATLGAHFVIDSISAASPAAGQTARFTERRYEAGLRALRRFGDAFTVSVGGRYSSEPDYVSSSINAGLAVDLLDKNATFSVASALAFDTVTSSIPADGFQDKLRTSYFGLSWTQVLGPRALAQVGYDLLAADGFQANHYRSVAAAGMVVSEEVPELRLRNALFANARWFEAASEVTVQAGYRLYFDDWGVVGHTPEIALTRDFGAHLELRARYRYYTQSAADFYQEIYDRVETFRTDDAKLSPFDGHTIGVRATLRLGFLGGALKRFAEGEVSALYDRIIQHNRFGTANQLAVALVLPY